MTWVHERIFAAGGAHIPANWGQFVDHYGPTAVLHLEPDGPMNFAGPPPRELLWLAIDHEQQADLPTRELAARFISGALTGGSRVLLHCRTGRHRTRWAFVAYLIWSGRTAESATRLAAQAPWLSPYETDQAWWQEFADRVASRRARA